jgi:hypothetical protein
LQKLVEQAVAVEAERGADRSVPVLHPLFNGNRRFIVDKGRVWFDNVFIKLLSADERLTNADSYASFAHECRVESPAKPSFVMTAPGGLGAVVSHASE